MDGLGRHQQEQGGEPRQSLAKTDLADSDRGITSIAADSSTNRDAEEKSEGEVGGGKARIDLFWETSRTEIGSSLLGDVNGSSEVFRGSLKETAQQTPARTAANASLWSLGGVRVEEGGASVQGDGDGGTQVLSTETALDKVGGDALALLAHYISGAHSHLVAQVSFIISILLSQRVLPPPSLTRELS